MRNLTIVYAIAKCSAAAAAARYLIILHVFPLSASSYDDSRCGQLGNKISSALDRERWLAWDFSLPPTDIFYAIADVTISTRRNIRLMLLSHLKRFNILNYN